MTSDNPRRRILAALRSEPRLGAGFSLDVVDLATDGTRTLAGEVESVARKKLALLCAAAPEGVGCIVDRLRVRAAEPMSDAGRRGRLRTYLAREPAFQGFALREATTSGPDPDFAPVAGDVTDPCGRIDHEVRDGVVILNGEVRGLVSKRLAGVMAWWIPGVRDVVNGIEPAPPEEDAPIPIEAAVRVVLDRDPFLDAAQIGVGVRARTVRLTGAVASTAERETAEEDAWRVFGVEDAVNRIVAAPCGLLGGREGCH